MTEQEIRDFVDHLRPGDLVVHVIGLSGSFRERLTTPFVFERRVSADTALIRRREDDALYELDPVLDVYPYRLRPVTHVAGKYVHVEA